MECPRTPAYFYFTSGICRPGADKIYALIMTDIPAQEQQIQARLAFPRGLDQPAGSFRFSLDALLLASFGLLRLKRKGLAAERPRLLDLGCGCGVVAFGLLLGAPNALAQGVDAQETLTLAAQANACRLGFEARFFARCHDLRGERDSLLPKRVPPGQPDWTAGWAGKTDLVAANPPYRLPGRGRLPAGESRRAALFAEPGLLQHFTDCAALALKRDGGFCLIFPAERLDDLLEALRRSGLRAGRILPVHNKKGQGAALFLVEAEKSAQGPVFEEPLYLYQGQGKNSRLTAEALRFCPHLSCNAKASGSARMPE